jgi:2-dehydro-3-deoxyphosphogalactonate aldolase
MSVVDWKSELTPLPLIAILRGIRPENTRNIIGALCDAGFRAVEVPLNSPQPLKSIEIAAREFADSLLVGAGTVLRPDDVHGVREAGGQFVVSPNTDPTVITATKSLELVSVPGVCTPSEAFTALKAGADILKAFPAEALPPKIIKAWRAVLPEDTWVLPVGGITPDAMAPYLDVGADGFGLGSSLFRPDFSAVEVSKRAKIFVSAYQSQ